MHVLLLTLALNSPFPENGDVFPHSERLAPSSSVDMAFTGDMAMGGTLTMDDDAKICRGDTTCDYWDTYVSGSTKWCAYSTDVDGGGSDGTVMCVDDGTDDVDFTGGATFGDSVSILSDSATLNLGAAGSADSQLQFDGTDFQLTCGGCAAGFTFNTSIVVGPTDYPADGGALGCMHDMSVSATPAAGTEESISWCVDGNEAITSYGAADNSGGLQDLGSRYGYLHGASKLCHMSEETLTFAANPGDASKTTSGLIPDGAFDIQVAAYTLVLGTNCTSVDYGDGTDVDLFGATIALTVGTTVDPSDYTAALVYNSVGATEVTITGNGGNCFDLSVRVMAFYCELTPPSE